MEEVPRNGIAQRGGSQFQNEQSSSRAQQSKSSSSLSKSDSEKRSRPAPFANDQEAQSLLEDMQSLREQYRIHAKLQLRLDSISKKFFSPQKEAADCQLKVRRLLNRCVLLPSLCAARHHPAFPAGMADLFQCKKIELPSRTNRFSVSGFNCHLGRCSAKQASIALR